jgi:hypothetical protein
VYGSEAFARLEVSMVIAKRKTRLDGAVIKMGELS